MLNCLNVVSFGFCVNFELTVQNRSHMVMYGNGIWNRLTTIPVTELGLPTNQVIDVMSQVVHIQ